MGSILWGKIHSGVVWGGGEVVKVRVMITENR